MISILHGAHFDQLFKANVILSARARRYRVSSFAGPLSIKTVVRGAAVWRVGGVRYTVDRTACLVVDHREPYELFIEADDPVETFVVFFAEELAADVATVRLRTLERLLDEPSPSDADVLTIARRLWAQGTPLPGAVAALRATAPDDMAALDAGLRRILDHCADLIAAVKRERDRIAASKAATRAELHRRVLRGQAALEDTLAEPFDLAALASAACLSPHHFHRTFAAAFGEAPYAYCERRRIERARRLLEESEAPVADVCAAVGYQSLPSFTTHFRHRVGAPPGAYRSESRKAR
jgi:AraC family transcriptional regulator